MMVPLPFTRLFSVPISQNLSTGTKTKNEHCTQMNSYNNNNNNKNHLKS